MANARVGSLSLVNDTLRDFTSIQSRLADLQNQVSSGYKSKDFVGLNGNVEQYAQLSGQLSRATQYQTNNQVNISKLQVADVALNKVTDIADQIKNIIVGANGATIATGNIPQALRDLMKAMGGELNTTFNGNYIFGGTDTITAPVPDTTVGNSAPGIPDDNYYVGAEQDVSLRADERNEIVFPVRADDIAFQKIYAGAMLAIRGAEIGDTSQMIQAQQLVQAGQTDLVAARSRIGTTVTNIQSIDARLKSLTVYWKELSDGISKTDIVAASVEVAGYEAVLQASFQVYSRLSQLRLSDYLQ
jgi:flagellar hook-associated protein 3 FlgL